MLNEIPLFDIFWQQVGNIIKTREELNLEDVAALLQSLTNFSLNCYPEKLENYEEILKTLHQYMKALKG